VLEHDAAHLSRAEDVALVVEQGAVGNLGVGQQAARVDKGGGREKCGRQEVRVEHDQCRIRPRFDIATGLL
jgi:hypothetical protein